MCTSLFFLNVMKLQFYRSNFGVELNETQALNTRVRITVL